MVSEDVLSQINNCLLEYTVFKPVSRFLHYVHALISINALRSSNSDSDYVSALSSNFARPYLNYFKCVPEGKFLPEIQVALVSDLADILSVSMVSPDEFIEYECPYLIPGSVPAVFDYLRSSHAQDEARSEIYDCIKIYALLYLKSSMRRQPFPPLAELDTVDCISLQAYIYSTYSESALFSQYTKLLNFNEECIFRLYILMFSVSYQPKHISTSRTMKQFTDKMHELSIPLNWQLRIYHACLLIERNTKSGFPVKEPLQFFRQAYMENANISISSSGVQGNTDTQVSSGLELLQLQDVFAQFAEKIKSIEPTDFLKSVFYESYKSDFATENDFIFRSELELLLKDPMQGAFQTLIINPNPELIEQIITGDIRNKKFVILAFDDEIFAELYLTQFPKTEIGFAYYSIINGNLSIYKVYISSRSLLKTDLRSEEIHSSFSRILYYDRSELRRIEAPGAASRQICDTNSLQVLLGLRQFMSPQGCQMQFYVPNAFLDNKYSRETRCREKLLDTYKIQWIFNIPPEGNSGGAKKKIFVSVRPRECSGEVESVLNYGKVRISEDPFCEGRRRLFVDAWYVKIPTHSFLDGDKTLNWLWQHYRPRYTPLGGPRTTRCYSFSKEIVIWYSWSPKCKRGRAYFSAVPTDIQARLNPCSRGKRLTPYYMICSVDEPSATKKTASLLELPECRKIIQKEILSRYDHKPISLKTYWYCTKDELSKKSSYKESQAQKLFTCESLSNLMSDKTYTLEDYRVLLKETFGDAATDSPGLWIQLDLILQEAAKQGYFSPNPINEYVCSMIDRRNRISEVRDALVKKSFTLEEEQDMLKYMQTELPQNGTMVGCALRFYTGLSCGEICALNWGDYASFFTKQGHQLYIFKIMLQDGTVTGDIPNRKVLFRRVALAEPIAAILDARRKYVLQQLTIRNDAYHLKDSNFDKMPIVTASAEKVSTRCPISALTELSKMVVAAANIPSDIIVLPIDGESVKETDLNKYQGDIFKSNFKYRTSQFCSMTQAETNYLLGLTMPDTFSKHYCDYSNDFAQIALARKLMRWFSLHARSDDAPHSIPIQNTKEKGIQQINVQGPQRTCLDIDFSLASSQTVERKEMPILQITVESTWGTQTDLIAFSKE